MELQEPLRGKKLFVENIEDAMAFRKVRCSLEDRKFDFKS